MNDFTFETATKDQAKARIALAGPSGAGKTWTALVLATRFGNSTAVIDTERGSASKYVGPFTFDRLNLTRYDPRDLPKALAAAALRGYDTVIVDSLSRFWSGEGGMLEQVDAAAKRSYGSNSFGGWKEARPMENAMIEALLGYPGHVIVTMRTKTAYDITTDDRGRKVPVKLGLRPEQRDGIEYEFDIVGDLDIENTLTVSKSRCSALSGMVIRRPDAAMADVILEWLSDGRPVMDASWFREQAFRETDPVALRELWSDVRQLGLLGAAVADEDDQATTLGELIARKGKEAIPLRPISDLPRNQDGTVSRSRTTDAEKDAAGLMTDAQQKEHTALVKEVLDEPERKPGSIGPELGAVQALFARWFTEDEREQRLAAAEQVINRKLTGPKRGRTFSNLSLTESRKLKDTLGDCATRDDLIARLARDASETADAS